MEVDEERTWRDRNKRKCQDHLSATQADTSLHFSGQLLNLSQARLTRDLVARELHASTFQDIAAIVLRAKTRILGAPGHVTATSLWYVLESSQTACNYVRIHT